MGILYDTKEERLVKQAEDLKNKACDKPHRCEKDLDNRQAQILKDYQDGKNDAATTVEKTITNTNKKAECKQNICDYQMHILNERQQKIGLEPDEQMEKAKHTGAVKIAESPARPVRDFGNAASQAAEAINRERQNNNKNGF